jgi:ABC-2 type transport system ATP-binding protein
MKLEMKQINKSFGDKHVLRNIDLAAEGGKALGILGRNGAGKTTSIRIIMGVFPPDSGEVILDGGAPDNSKIGYLPEERGLYPKKVILDQLVYFAMLKGMKKSDAIKSIDYWLQRLEMGEYKNKKLDTLSKGNQQKIQLITAVAHDPDIVILDEPFSGLDPVNAMLLKDVVRELIEKGKIVLFSSHQMNYIEEFCDNIAILNGGNIVLSGNLKEIKHNYRRDKLVVVSNESSKIKELLGPNAYFEQDKLIVKLNAPSDKQELMVRLSEKFDIDEIRVYEPSLNDIFVEYTENNI